MKKTIVLFLMILLMTACSKERSEYEELLVEQFSKDQDVIDYHLDPEDMAACVTDQVADDIPGFPGSPVYADYFNGYKLLLRPEKPADIPKRMEKANEIFGSKQATSKARLGVTNHILFCMPQVREKNERSENLFKFGDD
ncbi:MAG TPA: hypothetical protein ENJ32_02170 [Crenotrichaceae bacterium]|nr:hypothetical protein [Crenotrichaceae bacterium]